MPSTTVAPRLTLAALSAAACLLSGPGCGGSPYSERGAHLDTAMAPPAADPDDAEEDFEGPPSQDPAWFGLRGHLTLVDGEPTEDSELSLSLWSTEGTDLLCEASPDFTATPTTADSELHQVWSVELEPVEGCPTPTWPPAFELGIGAADPQLAPAADASGTPLASLYGLYLQADGPLFIFGVAGTEAQFAAESEPSPDLADGRYRLEGLYLLPL